MRTATRVVTKATEVEYKLPLDDFWLEAKEEIIQAIQDRPWFHDVPWFWLKISIFASLLDPPKMVSQLRVYRYIIHRLSRSDRFIHAGGSCGVGRIRLDAREVSCFWGWQVCESVTEWPELFDSILGPLLDTPGCFDTKLRFTSQEAAQRVGCRRGWGKHKMPEILGLW